ncbi:MAG: hypothetical protein HQK99_03665 [Nitrospirae bacterium]|nr:hypothetical protein [Nitrospirota bacterium]
MKNKNILVIRCTDLQHLDKVFKKLRAEFPDAKLSLLTHRHGAAAAAAYTETVIVYPYTQSYGFFRDMKTLNDMNFDTVVIPVGNVSGSGFLNVFLFTLTIKTGTRLMCNLPLELKPLSKSKIIGLLLRNSLYTLASGVLAAVAGAVLLIGWPVFALLTRGGKSSDK